MANPKTETDFNKAYKTFFHLLWTDKRIPKQLKTLVNTVKPANSLELGCGLGYFSEYMAKQDIKATGVDLSSIAIEKAKKRTSDNERKATYFVSDVTNLPFDDNQYDVVFDIGCFHCLNEEDEREYAAEVHRVLKPDGILLIWTLNHSPAGIYINSKHIEKVFMENFILEKSEFSRRRLIASNWFWLKKK